MNIDLCIKIVQEHDCGLDCPYRVHEDDTNATYCKAPSGYCAWELTEAIVEKLKELAS